jgi:hypothetical protein
LLQEGCETLRANGQLMTCYYQGCQHRGTTKEHIPPKAFFPKDQREQLLTVPSCELHNNAKSTDDIYVLAHICLNSSPSNRSREVFVERVVPQLGYNREAMKKTLLADSIPHASGAVSYKVDSTRFDRFFTALSFGIVYKACRGSLRAGYRTGHVYHNFQDAMESPEEKAFKAGLREYYDGEPLSVLNFGQVNALNTTVYSVKVIGIPGFRSSITVAHDFFGVFHVTSMLSKQY